MGLSFFFNSQDVIPNLTQFTLHPGEGSQAHRDTLIGVFMFLQIFGGHIGMPLILLTTAFSKKIQKNPMFNNFCVIWFIYSTSFTLVLYAGKQIGPEPPIELCVIQAAFIYGTPVMASMGGLAFVLHLWLSLQTGRGVLSRAAGGWRFMLLLGSPYILFLGFSVAMAVLGSLNEATVSRSRYLFYCTINLSVVNMIPGTTLVLMLGVIVFEVLTAIELYRRQKAFKNLRRTSHHTGPPLHLFIRVGIFSLYSALALAGCVAFWAESGADFPYLVQASYPTAAFIIFGTQKDYLRAWGITAAIEFISRPCRRRSTPKGASMRWEIAHPTGGPPNQAQATNTIGVLPAASPEKSSDTGRIFETSGTLSEKDTQMFEELYSNMVRTC
ncbi:hypothetical protein DFH08DRAFT_863713 [Mycena albidolilacea]|uniref:Uncharacterized protein n=1 Tax=Mycena albidolilacea TaxID=1033008 RepID=A0AAD7A4K6_9AGAR|nr:hypothetical protein DFH08DRAFT_863713 [Mycena albidolilacea]